MPPQPDSHLIELSVADVAFGGNGVARHDGKAIFIPFAIDGEKISARIVRERKRFAEAVVESVVEPSPDRVEPPCPYFGTCGGCSYQHIAYGHQLRIKSSQVEQTLRRVGRIENVPMQPIIASPLEYGYRNRIRMHVESGRAGFYGRNGHQLVEIDSCVIASEQVNDRLRELRGRALYDGDYTLAENTSGRFFSQTNNAVAEKLLDLVEGMVKPGGELLVDAYCGAGFFAKRLRPLFQRVIGIEENEHAVAQAREGAGANETYFAGDVELFLGEALSGAGETTLVLDPPATGISPRVSDLILASMPREIIYVSCNPATLARDLGHFCRSYQLISVTPLDMFPQTAEIEVAARLRR